MLNTSDTKLLEEKGISLQEIEQQIDSFKKGFPFLAIKKSASIGDGILKLESQKIVKYSSYYELEKEKIAVLKFVPASGAASRMFKKLFEFIDQYDSSPEAYQRFTADKSFQSIYYFFKHLDSFAFYDDLKKECKNNQEIEEKLLKKQFTDILSALLYADGLNYGNLPKGLLKFHSYDKDNRTPVEEHLSEAGLYANSSGVAKLHFTVSPEFMVGFQNHIREILPFFEEQYKVEYQIEFSIQKSKTDTIAVDLNNQMFRDSADNLVFRPGGHGALIENLNELDADLIFVKNIDNIIPDKLKSDTVTYKKALAGVLLDYQQQSFDYLNQLESTCSDSLLIEIEEFLQKKLFSTLPESYADFDRKAKSTFLFSKLNRPIRVCGMVKNEGEPGGGPFWAQNTDGSQSLQIVESSQINLTNPIFQEMLASSTHFNPVDLVCGIKNYTGKKFDLTQFVDPNTGFITEKSLNGKTLKAMELPGLWNGAMADWNTIFVEVPISTFNPVKTVNDLLREQHQ